MVAVDFRFLSAQVPEFFLKKTSNDFKPDEPQTAMNLDPRLVTSWVCGYHLHGSEWLRNFPTHMILRSFEIFASRNC